MAKKAAAKKETKSEFLRKALSRNPNLEYDQLLRRWIKKGHTDTFSTALYYQVRAKLGIRSVWQWVYSPKPPAGTEREVYQLKITLRDSHPPIWRRIQVKNCTLDQLHEYIQTAMGWTNSHMHHFRIGETLYGHPRLMAENFEELGYRDSMRTWLSEILPSGNKKFRFLYEYDFGDSWDREILFEGRSLAEPRRQYPVCLDGKRACPPEDVGGIWGYADFLEVLADPKHPEHDEMKEWVGGKFDPDKFSPTAATREMRLGLPAW